MSTGERPTIPNYLVQAILVTLCCGCWPLGIVAIIYSAQVNSKLGAGDVAGTGHHPITLANGAGLRFIAGIVTYVVIGIIYAIIISVAVQQDPELKAKLGL